MKFQHFSSQNYYALLQVDNMTKFIRNKTLKKFSKAGIIIVETESNCIF